MVWRYVRLRIYLIEEAAAILLREYAGEAPGLLLERLHILDFYKEHVAWLGGLDFERPGQVVDSGEVDVADVVCRVVVTNLSACPVEAFDLYDFAVLDGAGEGDCMWVRWWDQLLEVMGDVLSGCQRFLEMLGTVSNLALGTTHVENLLLRWWCVQGHLCGIADL